MCRVSRFSQSPNTATASTRQSVEYQLITRMCLLATLGYAKTEHLYKARDFAASRYESDNLTQFDDGLENSF